MSAVTDREYMIRRLRLLHEGGALVGTPEENLARHDQAYADLLRVRAENQDNRDLIGG